MKLFFSELKLWGHHGFYEAEQKLGNYFYCDIQLDLINVSQKKNFDLNETINYEIVYSILKQEFLKPELLLENLCIRILHILLNKFTLIQHAQIKIRKENMPIASFMGKIFVEYELSKNDL